MAKILLCRFKQSFGPFKMLIVHRFCYTEFFWHLSNPRFLESIISETNTSQAHLFFSRYSKFSADMKALNVFKYNIFNILCFMYKCKQNVNPPVFHSIFTHITKTKYALRNEYSFQEPLCRTNFSQYCISYRGPYLWNKIVTSKNLTFGDSDSLQAFKCELKRFLLSVELNHLGILE